MPCNESVLSLSILKWSFIPFMTFFYVYIPLRFEVRYTCTFDTTERNSYGVICNTIARDVTQNIYLLINCLKIRSCIILRNDVPSQGEPITGRPSSERPIRRTISCGSMEAMPAKGSNRSLNWAHRSRWRRRSGRR